MSLPVHLQETFSPEEIQFMVENEKIKIFPRITTRERVRQRRTNDSTTVESSINTESKHWKMITMDDIPLNNMVAMKSTTVSLWVALLLKQQSKCNIIAPEWLTMNALDRSIHYEQTHQEQFSPLPWDWLVLSEILFKRAADDFHDPVHELRSRIQDLREIRQVKVLKGLKFLNESHLQLDNLSLLEINELRPFIIGIMDKLKEIHSASIPDATNEDDANMFDDEDDFDFGTARSDTNSSRI